ncbi:MAG: signal recognition particle-docking protein FtsY [candidate division KSB1 bacterium]|nr:signal recognition particle-docking protein FtsY [candidate division KSB1 bacterium]
MKSLVQKIRNGLSRTRSSLVDGIGKAITGRVRLDEDLLEIIEERLIAADMGVNTAMAVIDVLREKLDHRDRDDPSAVFDVIKDDLLQRLQRVNGAATQPEASEKPYVIMVVGVNGVGKTTTIGKLAHLYKMEGKSVILGAADTFRAAAQEQLAIWAERAQVALVRNKPGADPASVAFDTVSAAQSRGADVVLIDTAGRLHTRSNLMEELKKIRRVIERKQPGAPHEVLLVLDATTGQNGLAQAKQFHEAVQVTGIVLTKLDGTAKGGIVFAIQEELQLPVLFVGVGEQIDDLQPFDPETYVEALFA